MHINFPLLLVVEKWIITAYNILLLQYYNLRCAGLFQDKKGKQEHATWTKSKEAGSNFQIGLEKLKRVVTDPLQDLVSKRSPRVYP